MARYSFRFMNGAKVDYEIDETMENELRRLMETGFARTLRRASGDSEIVNLDSVERAWQRRD